MTPLRRRLLAATLGLCLALGLFVAGANAVVLAHGRRGVYASPGEAPPRAVAIVLGAHVHRNGTPSDALEDRLAAALALYRDRKSVV